MKRNREPCGRGVRPHPDDQPRSHRGLQDPDRAQGRSLVKRFGSEMPAGRILVNSPCAQGVVGMTSGLEPSFTLGCGTFGKNSTTDNVGYRHLLNVKRLAYYLEPAGAQGV